MLKNRKKSALPAVVDDDLAECSAECVEEWPETLFVTRRLADGEFSYQTFETLGEAEKDAYSPTEMAIVRVQWAGKRWIT